MSIKLKLSKETLRVLNPIDHQRAFGAGSLIFITNTSDDTCANETIDNCGTGYSCACIGIDYTCPCITQLPPPPTTATVSKKPAQ